MKNEYLNFLPEVFLFKGIRSETLKKISDSYSFSLMEFSKGEIIFSSENLEKKIGFVYSGECRVERLRDEGDSISLNTLKRYDSFGILAVLSRDSEYPTRVVCSKNAAVLFMDGDDLISIIKTYPEISYKVIEFLTSRISFLNKKIVTFSGKSTAQKLASYLLSKYREYGPVIKISRTKVASELGIGRASVYRDLSVLEEKNLIRINQKEIIINCPEGLERI